MGCAIAAPLASVALGPSESERPDRAHRVRRVGPGDDHPDNRRQGLARTVVPLSVSEMRRLFWRLVLATQQRVERILAWSTWRRWHQGIAKYWHYKRRATS